MHHVALEGFAMLGLGSIGRGKVPRIEAHDGTPLQDRVLLCSSDIELALSLRPENLGA